MKKLFRAVSAQEKNDIIATNSYRMHPSMPTGTKYFVETEAEGRHIQSVFTMTDIFNDGPYCLSFGHFDKALPNKVFIAVEGYAIVLDDSYFPHSPATML